MTLVSTPKALVVPGTVLALATALATELPLRALQADNAAHLRGVAPRRARRAIRACLEWLDGAWGARHTGPANETIASRARAERWRQRLAVCACTHHTVRGAHAGGMLAAGTREAGR